MAKPMTADQIISQLKTWRVPYHEYKSWRTHNRNSVGDWGPLNGFMVHHTGSDAPDQRPILYNGYDELPGPLCHFGIDQIGYVHLIGWGRANHAGGGDPSVLEHVIKEDYTGILKPRYHQKSPGATDGNTHFYGVEIWYSGSHEMTPAQYRTLLKLSAAICAFHSWGSKSVIGHGEWSDWKWDPGTSNGKMANMALIRSDIANTLLKGANPVADTPSIPETAKQVWKTDAFKPPEGHATDKNPVWTEENILRFAAEQAEQANKNTALILQILQRNNLL